MITLGNPLSSQLHNSTLLYVENRLQRHLNWSKRKSFHRLTHVWESIVKCASFIQEARLTRSLIRANRIPWHAQIGSNKYWTWWQWRIFFVVDIMTNHNKASWFIARSANLVCATCSSVVDIWIRSNYNVREAHLSRLFLVFVQIVTDNY